MHHAVHHVVLVLGFVRSLMGWRCPALAAGQAALLDALTASNLDANQVGGADEVPRWGLTCHKQCSSS